MRNKIASTLFLMAAAMLFPMLPGAAWGYEKELTALAESLKEQLRSSGKKRAAVVDFTDLKGNVTELGRFVAEELSTDLLVSGEQLEVVDRSHLQVLLKENKLSASGLVDPKDAQKIVKVSGVDALIAGTVTSFRDSFRLSVKILDAETARLLGSSKANLPSTEALKELDDKDILDDSSSSQGSRASGAGGGAAASAAAVAIATEKKVEEKGIAFQLQKCERNAGEIKCEFLLTSLETDLVVSIFANSADGSYFIDAAGNAFYAKNVLFGNAEDHSSVLQHLYKNAPMKMILNFDGTVSPSEVMTMLSVKCRLSSTDFIARFQGVHVHAGK